MTRILCYVFRHKSRKRQQLAFLLCRQEHHVDHTPQEAHCIVRENGQRDAVIGKLEERIGMLESRLNEIKKQPNTDVIA
jgi:hypothetical protein